MFIRAAVALLVHLIIIIGVVVTPTAVTAAAHDDGVVDVDSICAARDAITQHSKELQLAAYRRYVADWRAAGLISSDHLWDDNCTTPDAMPACLAHIQETKYHGTFLQRHAEVLGECAVRMPAVPVPECPLTPVEDQLKRLLAQVAYLRGDINTVAEEVKKVAGLPDRVKHLEDREEELSDEVRRVAEALVTLSKDTAAKFAAVYAALDNVTEKASGECRNSQRAGHTASSSTTSVPYRDWLLASLVAGVMYLIWCVRELHQQKK